MKAMIGQFKLSNDSSCSASPGLSLMDLALCRMKCSGLSTETIETALLAENATRCRPPLDEDEVRGIARRAYTQPDVATFDLPIHLESEFFPLMSFDYIINNELPPIDWLVKGLLFAVQDRVLWYGEFGSFKSWLLLDMALAHRGRPTDRGLVLSRFPALAPSSTWAKK